MANTNGKEVWFKNDENGMQLLASFLMALTIKGAAYNVFQNDESISVTVTGF
jgi:hypothetical protein